jgi:hypothetical protein
MAVTQWMGEGSRNGIVNCDFDGRDGDQNKAETEFSRPGNLILNTRSQHGMYVGKRTPDPTKHSQIYGMIYEGDVSLAFGATPSPFPYHRYSWFVTAAPTGDDAEIGPLPAYDGREPISSLDFPNRHPAFWPWDAWNRKRAKFSVDKLTVPGPVAAKNEVTGPTPPPPPPSPEPPSGPPFDPGYVDERGVRHFTRGHERLHEFTAVIRGQKRFFVSRDVDDATGADVVIAEARQAHAYVASWEQNAALFEKDELP